MEESILRTSNNKSKHLLDGMFLLGLAIGAVFVLAIGVDGRFTNNQKVPCLTFTNGICILQVQTGTALFNFPAGQNRVCNLVPYSKVLPTPLGGRNPNITFSFAYPHYVNFIFPLGELPLQGMDGTNVTDTFVTGGSGVSPIYVPNTPRYFRFMPQLAWSGFNAALFQISMLEYDNNATDTGVNPLGSLQIWSQFFPTTGTQFNGYLPQPGAQWHNLTSIMTPDNITDSPPIYPYGFESATPLQKPSNIPASPILLRVVYANNFNGAVPEKILFSDMKISIYGSTVDTENVIFAHATNMNLCLFGAVQNAFVPYFQQADVQWTMTTSCAYSQFTQGTPNVVNNYVQC